MLSVLDIYEIRRLHFNESKSIRSIAKILHISKNSVKKVIKNNITEINYIRDNSNCSITKDYRHKILQIVKDNLNEPSRRRLTAKRIYEMLQSDGYAGSYESINILVQRFKSENKTPNKVFIPLEFAKGEAFQFDWGTEEIMLEGVMISVKAARVTLIYSGFTFVIVLPNEQMEMVVEAHNAAFKFFQCIPKKGIYDNMKTAVNKILIGKDREYNVKFKQMESHYLFETVACTPYSGWEKGRVEKQVGDTRRNIFTPILIGNSYEEINEQVANRCIEIAKKLIHKSNVSVYDAYLDELTFMKSYKQPFIFHKLKSVVVYPTSIVNFDTNKYSVDCDYVGRSVTLLIKAWDIKVLYKNEIIAEHKRSFGKKQYIYNPLHYIKALKIKPGALRNGIPFKDLMNYLPRYYTELRGKLGFDNNGDREFAKILQLSLKYKADQLETAITKALAEGITNVSIIEYYINNCNNKDQQNFTTYVNLATEFDSDCCYYSNLYLGDDQ